MPSASCTRCFAVFAWDDVRPGAVPVCSACAPLVAFVPPAPAESGPDGGPRPRRRWPRRAGAVALVVALAAAAAALLLRGGAALR